MDDAVLSEDERARAARYVDSRHCERWKSSRVQLRNILSSLTAVSPSALTFESLPDGKPFLREGPHFNLSHSEDRALLAVAPFAVGIDVERVRPIERESIARRYFTAEEQEEMRKAADPLRRFFEIWTAKEAALKCTGEGLRSLKAVKLAGLTLLPLEVEPNFVATLAAPARAVEVRYHDLA